MKANNKELFKKTTIITIGNISTKLISFLLLPFYTYILTTEEYGSYDLLHTYIYLIVPILSLQIDQAVFKFLVDNRVDKNNQKTYVSTTTLFMLLQVVVYVSIFLIIRAFWKFEYLPYMALMIISTVMLYDTQQMVRGINKTTLYAVAGVISSSLGIGLNILFLTKFNMRVDGLFLAGIISSTVAVLFLWCTSGLHRYLKFKEFSVNILKKELKFGVPLVPNELAWWVIHASDRTIVSTILGVASNGIIAVSQKFSSAYITLYNIFNLSWTESVIVHFKEKNGQEYIKNTINSVTTFFASMSIGIVAVMPFIFSIFIDAKYATSYGLIPIYMIAGTINVYLGMLSAIFVAQEKTRYIALTTILAAVINIIVHLSLIKWINVYAAPISTVVGYFTVLVIRYLKIRKETSVRLNFKKIAIVLFLFLVTLVGYYLRNKYVSLGCLLFDVVILILLNRTFFTVIKDFVFKKILKRK